MTEAVKRVASAELFEAKGVKFRKGYHGQRAAVRFRADEAGILPKLAVLETVRRLHLVTGFEDLNQLCADIDFADTGVGFSGRLVELAAGKVASNRGMYADRARVEIHVLPF